MEYVVRLKSRDHKLKAFSLYWIFDLSSVVEWRRKMDYQRRVIRFLEKEIKTYTALALFFAKRDVKEHILAGDNKVPIGPKFYKQRMKEAERLVDELRRLTETTPPNQVH